MNDDIMRAIASSSPLDFPPSRDGAIALAYVLFGVAGVALGAIFPHCSTELGIGVSMIVGGIAMAGEGIVGAWNRRSRHHRRAPRDFDFARPRRVTKAKIDSDGSTRRAFFEGLD